MKYNFILFVFMLVITRFIPTNAIQCRTCSEDISCSLTTHVKEWKIEECPSGDHNCNIVWEKSESGSIKLQYGGCANSPLDMCYKNTENNNICISTCEGSLCNEFIKLH